jgi:hypothetical protein
MTDVVAILFRMDPNLLQQEQVVTTPWHGQLGTLHNCQISRLEVPKETFL